MSAPQRVLVTGATGFVGRAVIRAAIAVGFRVTAATRNVVADNQRIVGADYVSVGEIHATTDWRPALNSADFVIHTAGATHSARHEQLQIVNVQGSERLAKQAVEVGVRRWVFVSSLGVHGAYSADHAIRADDPLCPHDAYTESKVAAEERIRNVLEWSATEWVIVRPPLIYGAEATGTVGRMAQLLRWRLPLPLGSIRNRRSAIGVRNLADFLIHSLRAEQAAGAAWVVADEYDYSSLELFELVARQHGYPCRAFPCPESWLRGLGYALGRGREVRQLTGSLFIDRNAVHERLSWFAPYSSDQQWVWQQ